MQQTIVAGVKEERLSKKGVVVAKHMQYATFLQKTVSKGLKNRLIELEEFLNQILQAHTDSNKKRSKTKSTVETKGTALNPM